MDQLENKNVYAYKKRGFFSGLIGKVEKNEGGISEYNLVYKDGSKNGFNNENEIVIVGIEEV